MRKASALLLVVLLLLCSVPSLAHGGRTDGQGGHTDHDTGEYHYHHGYSAHDHYDMDGDGDLDCPYNFVDKTDHSSGGSGSFRPASTPTPTPKTTSEPQPTNTKKSSRLALRHWVAIVSVICSVFVIAPSFMTETDGEKGKKHYSESKETVQFGLYIAFFTLSTTALLWNVNKLGGVLLGVFLSLPALNILGIFAFLIGLLISQIKKWISKGKKRREERKKCSEERRKRNRQRLRDLISDFMDDFGTRGCLGVLVFVILLVFIILPILFAHVLELFGL